MHAWTCACLDVLPWVSTHTWICTTMSAVSLLHVLLSMGCTRLRGVCFLVCTPHQPGTCFLTRAPKCSSGLHTPGWCALAGTHTFLGMRCARLKARFPWCELCSAHKCAPRCTPLVAFLGCTSLGGALLLRKRLCT